MMSITKSFPIIVSIALLMGAEALFACSSCTSKYSQEKLDAYLLTIFILGSAPFVITGAIIAYYYTKKSKKRSSEKK